MSTSDQNEAVGINFDCSTVMTKGPSDSPCLGNRVLRQKDIFRLQF